MAEDPKPKDQRTELEYEGPEIFELGDVEELTFGPSANKIADAHDIQHPSTPSPC